VPAGVCNAPIMIPEVGGARGLTDATIDMFPSESTRASGGGDWLERRRPNPRSQKSTNRKAERPHDRTDASPLSSGLSAACASVTSPNSKNGGPFMGRAGCGRRCGCSSSSSWRRDHRRGRGMPVGVERGGGQYSGGSSSLAIGGRHEW